MIAPRALGIESPAELIAHLIALADCDARAGQPLGKLMRLAADVLTEVRNIGPWDGQGEDLLDSAFAYASADRNPEGQGAQRLGAEHESAVPKADAQTPSGQSND